MKIAFLFRNLCAATTALLLSLLGGCAYQGTIVQKQFRPLPFPDSLGIEGIYDFALRDHNGIIHHQMVTPTVFVSYQMGEYFNDLKWPTVSPKVPTALPSIIRPRLEENATHYRQAQPMEDSQPRWLQLQDGFH